MRIMVPEVTEDGLTLRMLQGQFQYFQTLPNWCEYVRNEDIYADLANKGIGFTVIKPVPWDGYCPAEPYAKMSVQILAFLLAVWLLRKQLFD